MDSASKQFANYAAKLCNWNHQLWNQILPTMLSFETSSLGWIAKEQRSKAQKTSVINWSLQRDLRSTRDSLNRWYEVNPNSIHGVYVGESFGTSTPSVSRITEPGVTHIPQAGGKPELFIQKKAYHPESSCKIDCSSEYATSEQFEKSNGSIQFFYSDDFCANWRYRSKSDRPWTWWNKKERSRGNCYCQLACSNRIWKLDN